MTKFFNQSGLPRYYPSVAIANARRFAAGLVAPLVAALRRGPADRGHLQRARRAADRRAVHGARVLAILTPPEWGNFWLALGFGGLQIGFGVYIARNHGG